ncbi:MAG: hypothetical protein IJQ68_10510 [Methanobrevibacter sp.]|uniref:hypothetical protein n=1 Tax=Methanobrevibacter sp. TaxID=66852 RepID=UPI0025EAD1D6|nr:hypothetical protein [Methanobrevibacter sp.]MBR0272399.1 hypothetical protein [Methanobrevibacter sp.]
MFLEYIFQENENNTEINNIVENYVNKKLQDYFDIVANKIDEINNETTQLKKDFQELSTIDDKILIKLDEIKKSVKTKPITNDFNGMPSLEVKHTTNTSNGSKSKKSTEEIVLNKNDENVLKCLPEMTESECEEYFKRIRSKFEGITGRNLTKKLIDEPTVRNISKKLGLTSSTVNNTFKKTRTMKNIRFMSVNDIHNAPIIYVKIIPDAVDEGYKGDGVYQFKQRYNNIGFELINNLYIKSKRGKTFDINAKQLKKLAKMVDGKVLTNGLFDECCTYLATCGVHSSSFECIIYHLVKGHFSMILSKYDKYLRQVNNPHFEVYNGTLRVNGQETKLNVDEVKKMLDGIPYGYSDDVLEEYVRELIDKNPFCPSECIRLIVDNYDDYQLKVLLKKEDKFVENNPQKRREKGFI